MALDAETKQQVEEEVTKVVGGALMGLATSAIVGGLTSLLGSNIKESDVSGDRVATPTEDKTALHAGKATGNETDGSLAKDEANAQQGEVDGSKTDADANANAALANENGAKAMTTEAGAMDVATKGMKIN